MYFDGECDRMLGKYVNDRGVRALGISLTADEIEYLESGK